MSVEEWVQLTNAHRHGKDWMGKCPAHNDKKASLSIAEGKEGCVLLKCHAGCTVDDILAAVGKTKRDLFPERMFASADTRMHRRAAAKPAHAQVSSVAVDWSANVDAFTDEDAERFADWRGVRRQTVEWLRSNKLIGLHKGKLAFPVHQNGKVITCHVRLTNGGWIYDPKGKGVHALVIGKLGELINVFESQFDAFAFIDKTGIKDGIIVTRGSGNGALAAGLIPSDAIVILWTQNDPPDLKTGIAPGEKWQADFCTAVIDPSVCIKRAKIPAPDLNDWTRDKATADDLAAAITGAEMLCGAEKPLLAGKSFIELAKLSPEYFEKDNLIGNRFLCREGLLEIAAPTHSGKSSASVQMKLSWAAGRPAFGIKPKRPLRIVVFQAENDEGDLAEMARGILKHCDFCEAEQKLILENVVRYDLRGVGGDKFLAIAKEKVREHKADLLCLDALQNYLGGNVRDPAIVIPFLDGLDRILVEFRTGAVITHHTPKTVGRDTSEWTTEWVYYGAGVAAIADRKRASIAIEPTKARGVFKFHATKRGDRIGWADEDGYAVFERFFCWNSNKEEMFWRDATEEDLLRIQFAEHKTKGGKMPEGLFNLVPPQAGTAIEKNLLFALAHQAEISRENAREFYRILISEKRIFEWSMPRPNVRPEIRVSRSPQPEPELPELKLVK